MEELYLKIEEYLSKQSPLKLENIDKISADSNTELVKKILMASLENATVFVGDSFNVQTTRGRRRSIGDITLIAKYYNPEIKVSDVQSSLLELVETDFLRTLICPDIHKRVWRLEGSYKGSFSCKPIDEYGLTYNVDKLKEKHLTDALGEYGGYIEPLI